MLMRPHQTIWRREHARRAAVLIDAARYYGAARAAMLKARSHMGGPGNLNLDGLASRIATELRAWQERQAQFANAIEHLVKEAGL